MHIGISVFYSPLGGSRKYLSCLLEQWHKLYQGTHRFTLFTTSVLEPQIKPIIPSSIEVVIVRAPGFGLFKRLLAEQLTLPSKLKEHEIDVLFCPANTVPWSAQVPVVVTFQNAAPFSEHVTVRSVGFRNRFRFWLLGILIRISARKATGIIFISNFFQDTLNRHVKVRPAFSTVIHHAVSPPRAETPGHPSVFDRFGLERDSYILCVSHLFGYKRIVELIRGYQIYATTHQHPLALVVAGGAPLPGYEDNVNQAILSSKLGRVVLTGALPEADIEQLLVGCNSFVFPSVCENCPNALQEALAAGKAVLASSVGVMPEIVGKAAEFIDVNSPADIARGISRVVNDGGYRRSLAQRALSQAQLFPSKSERAQATLDFILSAASGGEANPLNTDVSKGSSVAQA